MNTKRFLAHLLVKTRKHKKLIKKSVSYFVAGTLLDLLIAKEYIYITMGLPLSAAIVSGIITIISTYIIAKIVKNNSGNVMLAYAAGNAFGTFIAI